MSNSSSSYWAPTILSLTLLAVPLQADPKSQTQSQVTEDRATGKDRASEVGKGYKYGLYKHTHHSSKGKKDDETKDSVPKPDTAGKPNAGSVNNGGSSESQSGAFLAKDNQIQISTSSTAQVPEPSSLFLMLSGLAAFVWRKRRGQ